MPRRSYHQYCSLAYALDVIGERWTLLLIRELMLGPRRFADLLENLPGIGRNLLTARLRHLEDQGLLRRSTLPAPAPRTYELTEEGKTLGPAMTELSRWGLTRLGAPRPSDTYRAAWSMFPLSYTANTDAARDIHEVYEFRIDRDIFHLTVNDGTVEPQAGPAAAADVTFTMDTQTILELMSGALPAPEALGSGRVRFEGRPEALTHALAILAGT